MNDMVQSICIVGGGSAGWLTAALIAARHQRADGGDLSITLVESERIGIVGVGEGTWPTMRQTLKKAGVSETDFLRACNASFKQGAKFARWRTGAADDFYYHPLMLPEGFPTLNLAAHWLARSEDNRDPATIPQSLQDQLELWRHIPPTEADFASAHEMFPAASYQYVLYGMGFRPDRRGWATGRREREAADDAFDRAASLKCRWRRRCRRTGSFCPGLPSIASKPFSGERHRHAFG